MRKGRVLAKTSLEKKIIIITNIKGGQCSVERGRKIIRKVIIEKVLFGSLLNI